MSLWGRLTSLNGKTSFYKSTTKECLLTSLKESFKMLSFSIWAVAIHVNDHVFVINEVHHMNDQS